MAYPPYVREKARQLRVEKHLSIDEIAARLALPKTTIYSWVRDLPLGRERRANPGQAKGNRGMRAKCRIRRAAAYALGRLEFERLVRDPTFRDFVCLYIAEGYKRNRNTVAVGNSDPAVVVLCTRWIRRFARNPVTFRVQYHADQYGVLTVHAGDTALRARLQGWIDCLQEQWLDSPHTGRSSAW